MQRMRPCLTERLFLQPQRSLTRSLLTILTRHALLQRHQQQRCLRHPTRSRLLQRTEAPQQLQPYCPRWKQVLLWQPQRWQLAAPLPPPLAAR